MRKNLSPLVGYLAHRDLGDMENLSYFDCVYMIKRAGSLTEITPLKGEIPVSGMNRNPYKHFSPPNDVNFNRGPHAYGIQIQTIMASVKSITRHHWTNEWAMEAAATAKKTIFLKKFQMGQWYGLTFN